MTLISSLIVGDTEVPKEFSTLDLATNFHGTCILKKALGSFDGTFKKLKAASIIKKLLLNMLNSFLKLYYFTNRILKEI